MHAFFISEPDTEILGGPEIYIEGGSTLNLTCVISGSPEAPSYVFWRHGDKVGLQHRNSLREHLANLSRD